MDRNEGPPDWMQQRGARGSMAQSQSYVKADLRGLHADEHEREESLRRFPGSVIKGVKIIAWLMLINTCIGLSFILVSLFPPAGTETGFGEVVYAEDYFSSMRMFISLVLGVGLAVIVWHLVDDEA